MAAKDVLTPHRFDKARRQIGRKLEAKLARLFGQRLAEQRREVEKLARATFEKSVIAVGENAIVEKAKLPTKKEILSAIKKPLTQQIKSALTQALTEGAAPVARSMGVGFRESDPEVRRFLEEHFTRLEDVLDDTTAEGVKELLAQGHEEGEGEQGLISRLRGMMDFSEARAQRISRTETHIAVQSGSQAAMAQAGAESREWITAGDNLVRESHVEANGQTRDIDEPFDVGDAKLMYPGDPEGGADYPEETIGCRCVTSPRFSKRAGSHASFERDLAMSGDAGAVAMAKSALTTIPDRIVEHIEPGVFVRPLKLADGIGDEWDYDAEASVLRIGPTTPSEHIAHGLIQHAVASLLLDEEADELVDEMADIGVEVADGRGPAAAMIADAIMPKMSKYVLEDKFTQDIAYLVLIGKSIEKYNPDQLRDDLGRFATSGGSAPINLKVSEYPKLNRAFPSKTKHAIREYTGDAYAAINRHLREADPKSEKTDIGDMAETLVNTVERFPPLKEEIVVYRGVSGNRAKDIAKAMAEGDEFTLAGLQSSSTSVKRAMKFVDQEQGGFLLQIKTKHGLPVKGLSALPMEDEVILGHEWRYRVTSVNRDVSIKVPLSIPPYEKTHVATVVAVEMIEKRFLKKSEGDAPEDKFTQDTTYLTIVKPASRKALIAQQYFVVPAQSLAKHLPGQHDQADHAGRSAPILHAWDYAFSSTRQIRFPEESFSINDISISEAMPRTLSVVRDKLTMMTTEKKFDEDQPRDESGRWTTSGSGAARGKDKVWRDASGEALSNADQDRLRALGVPPAWTGVRLNPDVDGDLQAVGKDMKGRTQYKYSALHSERAAAEKFERLKAFAKRVQDIRERVDADLKNPDLPEKDREAAAVLRLIDRTAFRIGSETDTGADVKAHGATTLEAKHVKVRGDRVDFDFIGKKGVRIQKTLEDVDVARDIGIRAESGGRLFATTDADVRDYLHSRGGGEFKVKDYRTYHGTMTAMREIKSMPEPKTKKEFAKAQKAVSEKVAEFLGNTASVAKASYIDPAVWSRWEGKIMGKAGDSNLITEASRKLGDDLIAELIETVSYAEDRPLEDLSRELETSDDE